MAKNGYASNAPIGAIIVILLMGLLVIADLAFLAGLGGDLLSR